MRRIFLASLLLPVHFFASTGVTEAQTRVTRVTVQDNSALGSPLAINGTVTLRETISNGIVRTAISEDILSRNISGKTILTLVVWVDVKPSYSSPRHFTRQYECFFAADVISSGTEHPLSQANVPETGEPYDPSAAPRSPSAVVTVVYVQFLDGSIFGHEAFGEDIQRMRRMTLKHLRSLDRIYTSFGEAAFTQELNETVEPADVETFFENIRQTLRQQGAQIAIVRIRTSLKFAEDRQAGFSHRKSRGEDSGSERE